jgi:hypothetical protein
MVTGMKKKKKKLRKPKLSTLKAKCWKLFSQYIRLRDADENGTVKCVTCGKLMFWEKDSAQAGHFIGGRGNAVLFDERLVHVQCYRCNKELRGNYVSYTLFMLTKHTIREIEEFQALKHKVVKFNVTDLQEKIDSLKVQVERQKSGLL